MGGVLERAVALFGVGVWRVVADFHISWPIRFRHIFRFTYGVFDTFSVSSWCFRHIFGLLMVVSTHFRSTYGVIDTFSVYLWSYGVFDTFSVYLWCFRHVFGRIVVFSIPFRSDFGVINVLLTRLWWFWSVPEPYDGVFGIIRA